MAERVQDWACVLVLALLVPAMAAARVVPARESRGSLGAWQGNQAVELLQAQAWDPAFAGPPAGHTQTTTVTCTLLALFANFDSPVN